MHKFDDRGEAAIVNLRKDPRFNEALYRELGPVLYWTRVREAEERIKQMKLVNGSSLSAEGSRDSREVTRTEEYLRRMKEREVQRRNGHLSKIDSDLPVEKATHRDRGRAANLAAVIIMMSLALSAAGIIVTVTVMACYGAWTLVF